MLGSTNSKYTDSNSFRDKGEKKNMEKNGEVGGSATQSIAESHKGMGDSHRGMGDSHRGMGDTYKSMGEKSTSAMSLGGLTSPGRASAQGQGLRQFSKTLPTPGKTKGQGLGGPTVSLRNLGKVGDGMDTFNNTPSNIPSHIPTSAHLLVYPLTHTLRCTY